jgi:DNA modification methylase
MPYISSFINRVINADCLTTLPQLPDGSVDFVLTDPPYLVGYHDRHGRSIAGDVDGQWLKRMRLAAIQEIWAPVRKV